MKKLTLYWLIGLALGFLAAGYGLFAGTWWEVLGGAAIWTLVEYVIHIGLHKGPRWFRAIHAPHHANPSTVRGAHPLIVIGFAALFFFTLGPGVLGGFGVAFSAGRWWHSISHGWDNHHWKHHQNPNKNYAVILPLWDKIFGTEAGTDLPTNKVGDDVQ